MPDSRNVYKIFGMSIKIQKYDECMDVDALHFV